MSVPVRPVAVAVSGRGLVDPTGAVLAADDEGFVRGNAAFETTRVYAGRPFRLARHLARLGASASRMGLPAPDDDVLEALVAAALEGARLRDAVLRLYWTPGAPGEGPHAIVLVSALPDDLEAVRAAGLRLVSLRCPRRDLPWLLPSTKSVSYAVNMAALAEGKRRGADDVVFVDGDGIVLEGPITNIWWREGDTLVTPSIDLGILGGETRAALLELAGSLGYAVVEGAFPVDRLCAADEAFTSSSVREVMPIVSLDDRPIPRADAGVRLQAALRAAATAP